MSGVTILGPRKKMKRADQRSSMTILVLGDESVGKSSLISTFVARYFSEVVPGLMTRVRLPPDPRAVAALEMETSSDPFFRSFASGGSGGSQNSNNNPRGSGAQQQHNSRSRSSSMRRSAADQAAMQARIGRHNTGVACVTTIVDSQRGDAALVQALERVSSTDSLQSLVERVEQERQQNTNSQQPTTVKPAPTQTQPNAKKEIAGAVSASSRTAYPQDMAAVATRLADTLDAAATTTATTHDNNNDPPQLQPSHSSGSLASVEQVDSIILVYDLDRVETFYRLESHWLPLIERCYKGKVPVIVAENKMDLFHPTTAAAGPTADEQALARKRQQIVALMQRFPFVRQCIKCSAKNLLRVDDVFVKAQQAVLYPFTPPLYDLLAAGGGRLSVACQRALTRLFRMYDVDGDGLLSDVELDRFQRETYGVPALDRDFGAWKKVVTRHAAQMVGHISTTATSSEETLSADSAVLRDGKFTVAGFMAIFDVFISQNRLDVVWQALRKFGYDDDLHLHVPDHVLLYGGDEEEDRKRRRRRQRRRSGLGASSGMRGGSSSSPLSSSSSAWKLSTKARHFLQRLFWDYDAEADGWLTAADVQRMMEPVLAPPALPPWHPLRAATLLGEAGCDVRPGLVPMRLASTTTSNESSADAAAAQGTTAAVGASLPTSTASTTASPASPSPQFLSDSGLSIFSATDSLPSIDSGKQARQLQAALPVPYPLSYTEWMGHWHALAAMSPAVTRAELFRLGHVERGVGAAPSMTPPAAKLTQGADLPSWIQEARLKSREMRILVLGRQSCGKTSLIRALVGAPLWYSAGDVDENKDEGGQVVVVEAAPVVPAPSNPPSPTLRPETSQTFVKLRRKTSSSKSSSSNNTKTGATTTSKDTNEDQVDDEQGEEIVVHLIFTDFPESAAASREEHCRELSELLDPPSSGNAGNATTPAQKDRLGDCDLAMLTFDATSPESLDYVKELESKWLTDKTPRVFVATYMDQVVTDNEKKATTDSSVLEAAEDHCRECDLEPPLRTSSALGGGGVSLVSKCWLPLHSTDETVRTAVLHHLARCVLSEPGLPRLRSRPHEEQQRREAAARRRHFMWLGGIVTVSVVVVAVGVVGLWLGSGGGGTSAAASPGKKDRPVNQAGGQGKSSGLDWLRTLFGGGR